jgi:hypothetical protein
MQSQCAWSLKWIECACIFLNIKSRAEESENLCCSLEHRKEEKKHLKWGGHERNWPLDFYEIFTRRTISSANEVNWWKYLTETFFCACISFDDGLFKSLVWFRFNFNIFKWSKFRCAMTNILSWAWNFTLYNIEFNSTHYYPMNIWNLNLKC